MALRIIMAPGIYNKTLVHKIFIFEATQIRSGKDAGACIDELKQLLSFFTDRQDALTLIAMQGETPFEAVGYTRYSGFSRYDLYKVLLDAIVAQGDQELLKDLQTAQRTLMGDSDKDSIPYMRISIHEDLSYALGESDAPGKW